MTIFKDNRGYIYELEVLENKILKYKIVLPDKLVLILAIQQSEFRHLFCNTTFAIILTVNCTVFILSHINWLFAMILFRRGPNNFMITEICLKYTTVNIHLIMINIGIQMIKQCAVVCCSNWYLLFIAIHCNRYIMQELSFSNIHPVYINLFDHHIYLRYYSMPYTNGFWEFLENNKCLWYSILHYSPISL